MSSVNDSALTGMSAETGYETDETVTPLRVSGFLALICGVLSGFALIAMPMLAFAFAALVFGFFALRRTDSESTPVGTTPARIGIVLAALFGAGGVSKPLSKTAIVGGQAEKFAREYLKLLCQGEVYYAMELNKEHFNRYLDSMPLDKYYASTEEAVKAAEQFRSDTAVNSLLAVGPEAVWKLDQPTRVWSHYGRNLAEVVLSTKRANAAVPTKMRVIMEYRFNQDDGAIEWQIDTCIPYQERIVAESIL